MVANFELVNRPKRTILVFSNSVCVLTISAEPISLLQVRFVIFDLLVVSAGIPRLEPAQLMDFEVLVEVASVAEAVVDHPLAGASSGGGGTHLAEPDVGVSSAGDVRDPTVVPAVVVEAVVLLARGACPTVAKLVGNTKVLAAKVAVDAGGQPPSDQGQGGQ